MNGWMDVSLLINIWKSFVHKIKIMLGTTCRNMSGSVSPLKDQIAWLFLWQSKIRRGRKMSCGVTLQKVTDIYDLIIHSLEIYF